MDPHIDKAGCFHPAVSRGVGLLTMFSPANMVRALKKLSKPNKKLKPGLLPENLIPKNKWTVSVLTFCLAQNVATYMFIRGVARNSTAVDTGYAALGDGISPPRYLNNLDSALRLSHVHRQLVMLIYFQ